MSLLTTLLSFSEKWPNILCSDMELEQFFSSWRSIMFARIKIYDIETLSTDERDHSYLFGFFLGLKLHHDCMDNIFTHMTNPKRNTACNLIFWVVWKHNPTLECLKHNHPYAYRCHMWHPLDKRIERAFKCDYAVGWTA